MTIAILKLDAGQKIARPFSRASSVDELREIIGNYAAVHHVDAVLSVQGWTLRRTKINHFTVEFGDKVRAENIDTETPVLALKGSKFYAFREA